MFGNLTTLSGFNPNVPYQISNLAHIYDVIYNTNPLGLIGSNAWRWLDSNKNLVGGLSSNSGLGATYSTYNNRKIVSTTSDNYFLYNAGLYGSHVPFGCPSNTAISKFTFFIVAKSNVIINTNLQYLFVNAFFNGASWSNNFVLQRTANNDFITLYLNDQLGNTLTINSNISTQTWNVYVVTFDNTTGIANLYVNGTLFSGQNNLLTSYVFNQVFVNSSNTGYNAYLSSATGTGNGYLGYLGDMIVYSRILTNSEINSIGQYENQKFNITSWINI